MVKRKKRFSPKRIILLVFIALLLLVLFLARNFISITSEVLFNKDIDFKKKTETINVLLLGIGGGNHDGPELTDTIMMMHINPTKNTVDLVSIPRDIWIPDLDAKINSAYSQGQAQDQKGILLAGAAVSKLIGKQIDYTVVVDFSAFVQLIDLLGGVEVTVERTLDDYEYPVFGKEDDLCDHTEEELPALATAASQLEAFPCRYQHLHFDKGVQTMDGETALRYVRSRHAVGVEGTDFARSQRQYTVINAVKDKVLSLGTLFNPVKVWGIYNVLKSNINTDIATDEVDDFIKLAQKMKDAKISSYVLDLGNIEEERWGLLIEPGISSTYRGQYVLIPRIGNGNFSEIHIFVSCIIETKDCRVNEKGVEVSAPSIQPD